MNKYSVILPVRNGGDYIKECVNSILCQTLQDFNLIILDNCSTDGTREWLTSLNNEKIIIYPSDKPLSIEENWSRIITVPKNEFITLIGHDDILFPDFLKNIDELMNVQPTAGLYHAHFDFINAAGEVKRSCKPMSALYTFNELLQAFLQQSIDSMGTGYVMRSKEYDRVGGIPSRYPNLLFADFELWLKLVANGGMAVHKAKSFAFRIHQSTTGNSTDEKLHTGLDLYIRFIHSISCNNIEIEAIVKRYGAEMLIFYASGFSHRLLRTPLKMRKNLTVKKWITKTNVMAQILDISGNYQPQQTNSILLAICIDSNFFTRWLFIAYKNILKFVRRQEG